MTFDLMVGFDIAVSRRYFSLSSMKNLLVFTLSLVLTAGLCPASTNVLTEKNEWNGKTIMAIYHHSDPEYIWLNIRRLTVEYDSKATNRLKVIVHTPDYILDTGDYKETTTYDTNGRIVTREVVRTNEDENRDCYGRRIDHYDSQPFCYMTEIIMTPACAREDMYFIRREYTDPRGATNQTWLFYTEEFRRATGRKYLITTWSPIHRMDDLAVVYSNDSFQKSGFSRVVEHYNPNEVLYLKELFVDPSHTNDTAYRAIRKYFNPRGRPEREEYLFTDRQERITGVQKAVIEYDDDSQWSKLTAYNGRGFGLARRYGADNIRKYLKSWGIDGK